jgi:hypothetical protein
MRPLVLFNTVQPGADESPKMTAGPFREPAAPRQMLYLRIALFGLRAAHECLPYGLLLESSSTSGTATGEHWLADGLLSQLS